MKQYKVEGLIYYSRIGGGKDHIIRDSVNDIQKILEEYAINGWRLVSTDKASFGSAMYIHLYFEK